MEAKAEASGSGELGATVAPPAAGVAAPPTPRAPTPPEYTTGWCKQDPDSLSVAVRTNIPDPDSNHDWGVMTVDRGGHYAGWDEVVDWTDMVASAG